MIALGFVALGLPACAANPPPPTRSADEAFAAIQVQEARIEHARATIMNAASTCDASCMAADDATAAAHALCELAQEVADPDALARCERGTRAVGSINDGAAQRCACEDPAP